MVWWWVPYLIKLVLVVGTSYLVARMSGGGSKYSSKPGEVEGPTAREGDNIPVLFGTRVIENQNVVWFGDVEAKAIKKSTGGK